MSDPTVETQSRRENDVIRHQDTTKPALEEQQQQFHDSIVRRTNELFVRLNITTRPIQAFEELQKSASSMFVAIFETLFNVRLKDVIRKPRVVTDYITNAELVMTALSKALPIDLSALSGERIYRGDPVQINEMLSIFESLWSRLLQTSHEAHDSNPHSSPTRAEAHFSWQGDPAESERATNTRMKRRLKRKPVASKVVQATTSPDITRTQLSWQKHVTGSAKQSVTQKKKNPSKRSSGTTTKSLSQATRSSNTVASRRAVAARAVSKANRTTARKRSSAQSSPARDSQSNMVSQGLERAKEEFHDRVTARKTREAGNRETKGSRLLRKSTKTVHRLATGDDNQRSAVLQDAHLKSLQTLAKQYPTIYNKITSTQSVQGRLSEHSRRVPPGSFDAVMENDLERYKRAYNLMVKTTKAEIRAREIDEKRRAQATLQAAERDKKIEAARTSRVAQDITNLERSRQLERQTKEELHVRKLFQDALKIEKETARNLKRMEDEERKLIERQRLNRYESLKRYYTDRRAILLDQINKDTREKTISQHARDIALRQIETSLRAEYKKSLDQMASQWLHHDHKSKLATEEELSQLFESWNDELSQSMRLVR
eukprot:CAMPEP_0184542980 /NCGR_PEP_ID=MMETSP0199_2-20130426/2584_1 /TAXON_ID=1112570 /ORGANISM="Thraustochytrium sp., Strain LLF1b" /LENGTH=602 /DNA_ID=CAMNT_0026936945 /DNA_START=109 /DNA_END=1917 /DNA_ORIENTATION=-